MHYVDDLQLWGAVGGKHGTTRYHVLDAPHASKQLLLRPSASLLGCSSLCSQLSTQLSIGLLCTCQLLRFGLDLSQGAVGVSMTL